MLCSCLMDHRIIDLTNPSQIQNLYRKGAYFWEELIMGLCTSKSTVALDPSTRTLSADRVSRAAGEGFSPEGIPILDEGILMVQPAKSKAEGGGGGGGGWTKAGGAVNHTAKGYLELGGKGGGGGEGGEVEAQTSREVEEEEEDEEGDEVEELINLSDSKGSVRSEFME